MSYSNKLVDVRWQVLRCQALTRDKFTCQLCGDSRTTLNIHHKKYTGKNPWDAPLEDLTTLCIHCHQASHELPNHTITSINKYLAEYCFVMTVFTETEIIFLYLFTKNDIVDIITVFQK